MSICMLPFCRYPRQLKAVARENTPNSDVWASASDKLIIVINPASEEEFENLRQSVNQWQLPVKHYLLNYKNVSSQFARIVRQEYKTIYRPKRKKEKPSAPRL